MIKVGFGYEQGDPGVYLVGIDGKVAWSEDVEPTRETGELLAAALGEYDMWAGTERASKEPGELERRWQKLVHVHRIAATALATVQDGDPYKPEVAADTLETVANLLHAILLTTPSGEAVPESLAKAMVGTEEDDDDATT